ncbi:MarR family transcriptional regulator [Planomonospora sp. ID67723]|uniref:MarR family winged helix-turn-helix transcriptional regulator n=1 Tax=Planomonospora sp. ID67723 TaxID=2738134 RepID=UPI0027DB1791|nr:MarR family transcriptional regulator [Planomonospora sp. ID67723]
MESAEAVEPPDGGPHARAGGGPSGPAAVGAGGTRTERAGAGETRTGEARTGDRPDLRYAAYARERLAAMPPPADPEAFELAYSLLQLAYLLVTDLETRIHRPRGWTLAGFRLMFKLWLLGPTQPARLAEISTMSRSAMTNAVNTLERDGLVERRPVPDDRRAVEIALTARGETAVREAFAEQTRREREWFSPLEAEERAGLTGLLTRILAARPDDAP